MDERYYLYGSSYPKDFDMEFEKKIMIGIDPGVKTGIGIYNKETKKLEDVRTCVLHDAFELILSYRHLIKMVRVEDARKRKHFGKMDQQQEKYGAAVREGAGSIKRDCKAWEDFLTAKDIPFQLVAPGKTKTKINPEYFKMLTGWVKTTSNHARDAVMLVWGF